MILSNQSNEKMLLERLKETYELKLKTKHQELAAKIQKNKIKYLEKIIKNCLNKSEANTIKMLREETDFISWLDILESVKDRYYIFMALRYTPRNRMSDLTKDKIRKLGFDKFDKKLWLMYAGFIKHGNVVFNENGGTAEEKVEFTYYDEKAALKINIKSEAYRKGNTVVIELNGTDYAIKMRGVNIVVYDPIFGQVIDSVGYDSHINTYDTRDYIAKTVFKHKPLNNIFI